MKRSTRFFVGLAAAVLTYAGLTAAVGPRHFRYRDGYPYRAYGSERHYRHSPCDAAGRENLRRPGTATPQTEPSRQPDDAPNNQ
jgi:hypothetical protein